jgi:hypothetical protein
MALNWNQVQARRSARTNTLAGKPVNSSAPNETTNLGAVSKIENTPTQKITEWRIDGVSPSAVDVVTGKLPPEPEKPPVWPSKTRPTQFAVAYDNLDAVLDASLITSLSLTESKPGKWTPVIELGEPEPI